MYNYVAQVQLCDEFGRVLGDADCRARGVLPLHLSGVRRRNGGGGEEEIPLRWSARLFAPGAWPGPRPRPACACVRVRACGGTGCALVSIRVRLRVHACERTRLCLRACNKGACFTAT